MEICAFTSICQEDARWIMQYLAEIERLEVPFVVHLDRCQLGRRYVGGKLIRRLINHSLCKGFTRQENQYLEFTEQYKQDILDLIASNDYAWAMAWDIDEVYERGAVDKLGLLDSAVDCYDLPLLHLWEDGRYARIDGAFNGCHRVKLYNLQDGRCWVFDHPITNGPKLVSRVAVVEKLSVTCLHYGLMTKSLREMHKQRWDRIYGTAVGANPYGFWNAALDESGLVVIEHGLR